MTDFDRFWKAYPKKVGKKAARQAFERAVKVRGAGHRKSGTGDRGSGTGDPSPAEVMIAAVERQKASRQWQRDAGRFIPNPATWLNQGRWEDEPPEAAPALPTLSGITLL